jgi:hypothetical protein
VSGVIIFHYDRDLQKHVPVAAIPGVTDLDVAYQATNNIMDSWSKRAVNEDLGYQDGHPDLILLRPLMEDCGHLYGHRSTMAGDRIEVTEGGHARMYEVTTFGFNSI